MPRILTILTFIAALASSGLGHRRGAAASDPAAVFESVFSDRDFDLSADPARPEWANAPRILAGKAYDNTPVAGSSHGSALALDARVPLSDVLRVRIRS